jgi:hypothetical protein
MGNINAPLTLNRYAYVNGQPISYVDPFGLSRDSDLDYLQASFKASPAGRWAQSQTSEAKNQKFSKRDVLELTGGALVIVAALYAPVLWEVALPFKDKIQSIFDKEAAEAKIIQEVSDLGPNKVNHILKDKHLWGNVVNSANDWNQVSKVMSKVMEQGVEGPYKDVFSKTLDVNGHTVEVTYTKLSNGIIKISDAWVRP